MPFDDNEIYKFIGLMFANGLNPRPKFESWFDNPMSRPMFALNFIKGVFDKRVHGVTISGRRRWQHLRRFLTLSNYHLIPSNKQKKNPMWKV